ncbi:ubiquitin C-terminal hydrolase L3 [Crucibulum laeve]|uniref:Ubiquitin carboxyl-terminal hydrolase n=1 Tax=Crucibulum laeve TaxID=68775 RepID=A0A5C3LXN1_9AGAR|nr:ubiquitin C-terminal hydrolase L3 [Crucibulum laeve]
MASSAVPPNHSDGSKHRKHYLPLESNPDVFTQLIHRLGVSKNLVFQDVYSLDDPDLLSFIPRPALALVLVFPTATETYEKEKAAREAAREEYHGKGEEEDVVWYRQTINNACGLYGILHAVSNGPAHLFIEPESLLSRILTKCIPLAPTERALALEDSEELEHAHHAAAVQGDSVVPQSAEDDVDYHYVCFVKSHKNGHLYEMDGSSKGPIDRGALANDEDVLGEMAVSVVKEYLGREEDGNVGFSLMVLVQDGA